jgi:putative peptide zinc metalloprotease protein
VVAGPGQAIAFVGEGDLNRVREGAAATFFDDFSLRSESGRVTKIDYAAVLKIPNAELTSVYGGPIKAHGSLQNGLYGEQAMYRVIITLDTPKHMNVRRTGWVLIGAGGSSLFDYATQQLPKILLREAHLD